MAVINFKDYNITELMYKKNEGFQTEDLDKGELKPSFSQSFKSKEENEFLAFLSVSLLDENFPFKFKVKMVGIFQYNPDDDSQNNPRGYLEYKANALAIMFPYLRSAVSQITLMSNEFRALQFPTINVNNFVEDDAEENKGENGL